MANLTPKCPCRPNPGIGGRTFGSNTAGSWGYHNVAGFKDGDVREVVTIYEVSPAATTPGHNLANQHDLGVP